MAVQRARYFRRNSTLAEKRLWARLRGRKAAGIKFRRQHPIGDRVVDFFARKPSLLSNSMVRVITVIRVNTRILTGNLSCMRQASGFCDFPTTLCFQIWMAS